MTRRGLSAAVVVRCAKANAVARPRRSSASRRLGDEADRMHVGLFHNPAASCPICLSGQWPELSVFTATGRPIACCTSNEGSMKRITKYVKALAIPAIFIPAALFAQGPTQTIVLRDGTQLTGKIVSADDHDMTFRERDGDMRHFNFDQVQSINFNQVRDYDRGGQYRDQREQAPPPPPPPAYPPQAAYQGDGDRNRGFVMVPAGAEISIRTNEGIDAHDAAEG